MENSRSLARRDLLKATAAVAAGTAIVAGPQTATAAGEPKFLAEEHWAQKGNVKLYMWRKQLDDGVKNKPVVFMAHGSSFSGKGGFDLQVPGKTGYSVMEDFAKAGFDVWTLDHENYGRSTRGTSTNSNIETGVTDLEKGFEVIEKITGQKRIKLKGQSSGAIRAGVFTVRHPEKVERLILDAFTWHGKTAPEIVRRREQVESYKANPNRKMDLAAFNGIFSRDDPSTYDPDMAKALADYELALGNTAPSGSYIDMAINMPMVDPTKITCPVLMTRAETDGNATDEELLEFFGKLATRDKQFVMMRGIAHVAVLGTNRHRIYHAMKAFLTMPDVRMA